jgi:hypothetical protein
MFLPALIFFLNPQVKKSFEKELLSHSAHLKDINHLPETGWSRDEIIAQTKIYLGLGEFDWRQGTQSGTVYNGYYLKKKIVKCFNKYQND